ncbi:MAG: hypothetical protein ABJC51_03935, partial [Acidobacteriota bacterium]
GGARLVVDENQPVLRGFARFGRRRMRNLGATSRSRQLLAGHTLVQFHVDLLPSMMFVNGTLSYKSVSDQFAAVCNRDIELAA